MGGCVFGVFFSQGRRKEGRREGGREEGREGGREGV
jgi:hypothetical protein